MQIAAEVRLANERIRHTGRPELKEWKLKFKRPGGGDDTQGLSLEEFTRLSQMKWFASVSFSKESGERVEIKNRPDLGPVGGGMQTPVTGLQDPPAMTGGEQFFPEDQPEG
jgi:hypothetical protein